MEIISQIFGTFLLLYIIALGFDTMTSNKSMSLSKGVLGITLKIVSSFGKLLIGLAIPRIKEIGEKIVYVTGYYLDKNKSQQPTLPPPPTAPQTQQPPPDDPLKTPEDKSKTSSSTSNPYDAPPEPEIMP